MTIENAILIVASDAVSQSLNPKAQVSLDVIRELQRRGDYDAKQKQSAGDVAYYLSADECNRVIRRAKEIREEARYMPVKILIGYLTLCLRCRDAYHEIDLISCRKHGEADKNHCESCGTLAESQRLATYRVHEMTAAEYARSIGAA